MNNSALTAAEPTLPPDEQAVTDWMKLRLADLRERSGLPVQSLNLYCTGGETTWTLHAGGQCVVNQPSIAEGVKALREKLAAAKTEEAATR
jgi:hypothetical protein